MSLVKRVSWKPTDLLFAMRAQVRLLLFVGYFFVAIGLLFLYRFVEKPRGGIYAKSFTDQVLCWAASKLDASCLFYVSLSILDAFSVPLPVELLSSLLSLFSQRAPALRSSAPNPHRDTQTLVSITLPRHCLLPHRLFSVSFWDTCRM